MKNIILLLVCLIFIVSQYKREVKMEMQATMKSEERVIKKYLNRKLYDTKEARYVTLEDLNGYVVNNISFKVIENKSQDDITKVILSDVLSKKLKSNSIVRTDELINLVKKFN